jgi:hypothetical protein
MWLWNRLARASRVLVLAVALTAFGCPDDQELGIYCQLMALVVGSGFDFSDCYDYDPGDYAEYRGYFDDVRAYQGLRTQRSIAGPGVPTFDAFMSARYADWPQRVAQLRASLQVRDATSALP